MKRYLDSSRPLRRRHRRPRSEPGLAATRHHRMPLIFERLEERTLLSGSGFSFDPSLNGHIVNDRETIKAFIETVDEVVFDNAIGHTLPLVGQFFRRVVGGTADLIRPIAQKVAGEIDKIKNDLTDETLKNALAVALEPALTEIRIADEGRNSHGYVEFIEYQLRLRGPLVTENLAAEFDPGLPALGLSLKTNVTVNAGYELDLGLGIDAQGFYVKTDPANTALTITLNVTTPGLDATGELGFLQVDATDRTGPNGKKTGFYGQFSISIEDSQKDSDSDSLETIRLPDFHGNGGELDDVSLDTTLTGQADVHLAMSVGILDASANFPSLHADFDLTWEFAHSTVDAGDSLIGFGDVPLVAFNNIQLDVGSFFNRFVNPILGKVRTVLEPLGPAIELLKTRIPVLSDIDFLKSNLDWDGDGNVTLLDVMRKLHPGAATKFLDAVDGVDALVKSIPTGLDETMIDLGGFNFAQNSIDARQPGNSGWEVNEADDKDVLGALSEKAPGFVSLITNTSTFGGGGGDDGEGLQFPLLQDPKKAFGLLIGQDVNLFTFDMPTLRAGLKFDMYFPLLGVLGVKLRGIVHSDNTALEASAHLAFGYDTVGLREFAAHKYETDYLADLLDGFFVSSTDQPDGSGTNFVPQFQLDVGLGVFAAVNVLVLEAGVGGGIRGDVDFYLHDDDRDGKVRPKEIQNSLACGGPLYIFDVDASLTAGLWAYVAVGVNLPFVGFVGWRDDFNIASVTLAEWHTLRTSSRNMGPPPPVLANLKDGVLTLNVEPDQTFTVDHCDGSGGEEWVYVSALGYTQLYGSDGNGVKEITADAGSNSTIIINPGVTANARLAGRFGNNHLRYLGSGTAELRAHGGGNELVGGAGLNRLYGDSGGDRLIGGTGTNVFYAAPNAPVGGQGDTMIGGRGPGDSTMHGSNGRDHFVAGAGRVTMCGGQGDVFSWRVGNGPATIIATPGEHSLLDVTGSDRGDTFVIGPDPGAGVIVNAKRGDDDPVTISASGIDTLSIAGRRGADRITFYDLAGTSLRFIGVNRDELTVNDGSVDVTEIQGPSGGTSLLAGVVNTPVACDANGKVTAVATPMHVTFNNRDQQFVVPNSYDKLVVNVGDGSNTVGIAMTATASRRLGQPYGDLVVNTGAGTNVINVRSTTGLTTVGGPGSNTFNIGSLAPDRGGTVAGIQGALTVIGGGNDVMTVDNSGSTKAATATLTRTSLAGLGMRAPAIAFGGIGSLVVNTGSGTNVINVRSTAARTSVGGPGANTFNIGSLAPAKGGTVAGIQGALTLIGGGNGVMTVDDTGSTTATGATLTPTTLTGLGMGTAGISFGGIGTLGVSLGATRALTGKTMTVMVDADRNLPASTTVKGGASLRDGLTATFARDFNGSLALLGFKTSTIEVGGNFKGVMTDTGPGAVQSITVGGSMTTSAWLTAGSINSMTIGPANLSAPGYDLAGTVQILGNLAQLGVAGSLSGRIIGRGNLVGSIRVGGDMSGLVAAEGDLGALSTGSSGPRRAGLLQVNGTFSGQVVALGNIIADLTINGDMQGGRVAAKGRPIAGFDPARRGILGAITVLGTIDGSSALVSGGEIGDTDLGTGVSYEHNEGIIAAKGAIRFAEDSWPEGPVYDQVGNAGPNAAAIDAIFTDHGIALGFDSIRGSGDLRGLALILKDLQALKVGSDGNLTGPFP